MKAIQLMAFAVIALFLISSVPAVMAEDLEIRRAEKIQAISEKLKANINAWKANESAGNYTHAEIIEIAKEALSNVIEKLEQHLARAKEKVKASEKLSEDEKAALIAAIEEQEAKLDEIKAQLEEADTFAELKEIAQELRSIAQTIKYKAIDVVKTRRVGLIVERAAHLEAKLNETLDKLQAQGYDIAELQELIDEFKEKIDEAKALFNEAQELWNEFYEIEARAAILQQARAEVREAKVKLKEVQAEMVKPAHEAQAKRAIDAAKASFSKAQELWDKFYEAVPAKEAEMHQAAHAKMKEVQAKLEKVHAVKEEVPAVGVAKASLSEAQELWNEFYETVATEKMKIGEARAEIMKQAHAKTKEAQVKLKEAHVILKQIAQKLRELKPEEKPEKTENETSETEPGETENETEEAENETNLSE